MVYKRYIKRDGKVFGPYYYESYRDKKGKVKTRFISGPEIYSPKGSATQKSKPKFNLLLLLIGVGVLIFLGISFSFLGQVNLGERSIPFFTGLLTEESNEDSGESASSVSDTIEGEDSEESSENGGSAGEEPPGKGKGSGSEEKTIGGGSEKKGGGSGKDSEGSAEKEVKKEEKEAEKEEKKEGKETNDDGGGEGGSGEGDGSSDEGEEESGESGNEEESGEGESEESSNGEEGEGGESGDGGGIVIFESNESLDDGNESLSDDNERITEINESTEIVSTDGEAASGETIVRSRIVINRQVRWVKSVEVVEGADLSVELPKTATEISVKIDGEIDEVLREIEDFEESLEDPEKEEILSGSITGRAVSEIEREGSLFSKLMGLIRSFRITGNVVSEEEVLRSIEESDDYKLVDLNEIAETTGANEVAVEYYTEAPQAVETKIENGKRLTVSAPSVLNYRDVLAFVEIEGQIKDEGIFIYWEEEQDEVEFESFDLDSDGFVEYIEWSIPHFSTQTFAIIYSSEHSISSEITTFSNGESEIDLGGLE